MKVHRYYTKKNNQKGGGIAQAASNAATKVASVGIKTVNSAAQIANQALGATTQITGSTLNATARIVNSSAKIATSGVKIGEHLASGVSNAAEAVASRTGKSVGMALNTGIEGQRAILGVATAVANQSKNLTSSSLQTVQHALNTVKSISKGVGNITEIVGSQIAKKKIASLAQQKALENASNTKSNTEKQKLIIGYQESLEKKSINSKLALEAAHIQFDLDLGKKHIKAQRNQQELELKKQSNLQKHKYNLLKLNKNSRVKTMILYNKQINTVSVIFREVNDSLTKIQGLICEGKYFSYSLWCKRIKNFNGNSFRSKIGSFKKTYKVYCDSIILRLKNKLQTSIDEFSDYYDDQLKELSKVNEKILEYIIKLGTIINQNELENSNKKNLDNTVKNMGKVFIKNNVSIKTQQSKNAVNNKNTITQQSNSLPSNNSIKTQQSNSLSNNKNMITQQSNSLPNNKNIKTQQSNSLSNNKNMITQQSNSLPNNKSMITQQSNSLSNNPLVTITQQ